MLSTKHAAFFTNTPNDYMISNKKIPRMAPQKDGTKRVREDNSTTLAKDVIEKSYKLCKQS